MKKQKQCFESHGLLNMGSDPSALVLSILQMVIANTDFIVVPKRRVYRWRDPLRCSSTYPNESAYIHQPLVHKSNGIRTGNFRYPRFHKI